MTTPITRAADRHLTLAALHEARPKPEKAKKTKRVPVEKRRKKLEKQIRCDIITLSQQLEGGFVF